MKFSKSLPISLIAFCLFFWSCQPKESSSTSQQRAADFSSLTTTPAELITSFSQWKSSPEPMISAHRGGPYPGYPENAIETFQYIVDHIPAIIECDISMTVDSVLVMMHDRTLDRTTTGTGKVTDKTYEELKGLQLIDNDGDTTNFKIPTLNEVLAWGKGKALFTLDVKRGVPIEKVLATVEKHDAASYAAIITYRIQDAETVHSLNSEVLISVSAGDDGALEQIFKSGIPSENLLGFVGTREPEAAHYEKLQAAGIISILGTLGNLDKSAVAKGDDGVYLTYVNNGANILATDRPLEAAMALKAKKQ